jgi:thioredoxin reductase (NADPH)
MASPPESIIETRRHQMFPILKPGEIERVRRFGEVRQFAAGETLATVGKVGPGLTVVLSGDVDVTRRDLSGHPTAIVTHGRGAFMGELAQSKGWSSRYTQHLNWRSA